MEKIKVKFKKDSPYGEYGYYRVGDIGTVVGYTQGCAVILKEDGSFVKVELNWIKEDINSIPENPVSEEDDKMKQAIELGCIAMQHIINLRGNSIKPYTIDFPEAIVILKSLKDRVQPQPKQEWSEEDEYCLDGAIETEQYMLDVVNGIKKFDVGNISIKEECTRELNWLKSLKNRVQPQPQQEWSEEDKAFYQRLEQIVCKVDIEAFQGDRDLHSWLKSLSPQNRWKPSESDIRILEQVIDGTVNPINYHATLYAILEQLKKLREE